MKIIGLVASNNGLGHARRMLNISSGFLKAGQSIKLFISKDQRIKLNSELAKMNLDLNLIEIESYGIDGPVWFKRGRLVLEPPPKIVDEIEGCDFIISDNLTWPFKYNENIALFGHFTWHDYWQRTKNFEDLKSLDIFEQDYENLRNIPFAFQIKDFLLEPRTFGNNIMINLPRYHSDIRVDKNRNETTEIWLSQGTTNLLDKSGLQLNVLTEHRIVEREAFELSESTGKPRLVIGRPGLGTIRDCLAMGIPFLPIWDKMDPELNSNVKHLVNLGLFPHNLLVEMKLQDKIVNFLEQQQILDAWKNIWPSMSEDVEDICITVLSNF
jgi:hypothetical protein